MWTKNSLNREAVVQPWSLPCSSLSVSGHGKSFLGITSHDSITALHNLCHECRQQHNQWDKNELEQQKDRSCSSWCLLSGRIWPLLDSGEAQAERAQALSGTGCFVPRSVGRFTPEQSNWGTQQKPAEARDICSPCVFSLIPPRESTADVFSAALHMHIRPLLSPAIYHRALLALQGWHP